MTPWLAPCDGARLAQAEWLQAAALLAHDSSRSPSIDLLYADPPFNTGERQHDRAGSFDDRFPSLDAYILWLRERLAASIPLLKPTASVLIHVDWRSSHRVRVLLDDLLRPECFVNHLIWSYGLGGSSPRRFARKHDDILFYAIDPARYWFQAPLVPATSQRMRGQHKKATDVIRLDSAHDAPPDVLDIPSINNMARERVGYPTQKPLALLDLLVRACCPPAGIVWDPCCGSGTTLVAAIAAGRRCIGTDLNPAAIDLAAQRLREVPDRHTHRGP